MDYEYGIDAPIRVAKTIDPASEAEAEEIYRTAVGHVLPTAYVVRAIVRCNQLDTFRMIACDYSIRLEGRHETIEPRAKAALRVHLAHAHPYLPAWQRRQLVGATQINLRDFGR